MVANTQLFGQMLTAMTGLVSRHPSEIKPGDTIRHAGEDVQVLFVKPHYLGDKWRIDFSDEYGCDWDYFTAVSRYEP